MAPLLKQSRKSSNLHHNHHPGTSSKQRQFQTRNRLSVNWSQSKKLMMQRLVFLTLRQQPWNLTLPKTLRLNCVTHCGLICAVSRQSSRMPSTSFHTTRSSRSTSLTCSTTARLATRWFRYKSRTLRRILSIRWLRPSQSSRRQEKRLSKFRGSLPHKKVFQVALAITIRPATLLTTWSAHSQTITRMEAEPSTQTSQRFSRLQARFRSLTAKRRLNLHKRS